MGYSAPRGTVDILPGQSEKWIKLEQLLRTIAANYNVKEMRTPIFEHAELFNRAVGDTSDVVSKEMYTFQDKKGRYISLRPEGTSGIARAYVENKMYGLPEKLQKVYYMGPMFRYERPQNGRQRQFHQFGVEMLGVESPYVDVECMLMAVTVVEALGLQNVTLHINSLGDNESRDAYREALKDHFRDHLDELCGDCKARFEKNPLRILDCKVDAKHPAMKTAPKTIDYLSESAKNHFDKVCSLLDDLEIDYVIDTNLVRGLDYYSHTVFEIISDDPKLGAGATGIARAYVENKMYGLPEKLQKVYYMGPMFRYERPQNGRQRQFHQFGVEMLGVESPYVDVECMLMAVTVVEALGLQNVTLHINSLGDNESRDAYREALKDHFRDHLDELCGDCKARFEKNPLRILDCKVDAKHPAMKTAPKTIDYLSESAKNHFDKVCTLLDDLEIDYVIDTNLVRGLDYYSHTVFEIISDDPKLGAGATVGGGGRYNGLIEEIGGPATPGVGFAFGMERLLLALDDEEDEDEDGLDCYIMPLGEEAKDLAMQIIAMLRANGFTCEMDHVSRGLKGQFKSADRFNAHFSIILGEEEVKNEVVNIKCNHDKEQEVVPLENILAHIENHLSGGHEHE